MPAVVCSAVIGLLCLTSPVGELKAPPPLLFEEQTYTVESRYKISYLRSDLRTPYDVKDYRKLCPQTDCLWVKMSLGRCSLTFEFVQPSQGSTGFTNTSYNVTASTEAGLLQALAETHVREREGRDDSFRTLEAVAGSGLPQCPPP